MSQKKNTFDVESFVERDRLSQTIRSHPSRYLALAVALVIAPFVLNLTGNNYWLTLMVELFVFSVLVISFDLLFGYTGLLSFGHALFFGAGAYIAAIVTRDTGLNFFMAVVVALAILPLLALVVGAISVRLTGVYFAILMLAFGQLGYETVVQFRGLTGGVDGISSIDIPVIYGFDPTAPYSSYFITLFVLILVYIGARRVINSPFGRVIQGIEQNEERMEMIGINVYQYKLASFTLASTLGGFAGGLYPLYLNFVDPHLMNWTTTGDVLMMTIIGGLGTLWGPVLGAGFYIFVQGYLVTITQQWRIVLGVIFVVFVLAFPSGIAGLVSSEVQSDRRVARLKEKLGLGGGENK